MAPPEAPAPSAPTSPPHGLASLGAFAGDLWAIIWRSLALFLVGIPVVEWEGPPLERLGAVAIGLLLLALAARNAEAAYSRAFGRRGVSLPWRISPGRAVALAGLGALEAATTVGLAEGLALDGVGGVELDDPDPRDALAVLMFVLGPVVLAPILEESIFRGLLLGGLLKWSRPLLAYGASAACFAIVHGTSEYFWLYFGSAIVWAHVARHHGVVATATAHAAYNALLILVTLLALVDPAWRIDEHITAAARTPLGAGLSAAGWVLSLALLWRLAQRPANAP
ncbi:MAG: CPBP family glutamic-type intramembrane protease [Gemmatimonadaceae bacterium]|jgi:membrane protease YdiL (CAAX protease family)|nr:CPBP family glutamic-type intramembrane protease [Gemmatimonadaceae bacterium]